MPRKPLRPCSYPGCPELVEGRYCEEHSKQSYKDYNTYRRDPRSKKRYGSEWKRIRNIFIKEHPLCEECRRNGRVTPAEEVHHILPLGRGGTHDTNNLMALCKSCHSRISVLDGDRFGR